MKNKMVFVLGILVLVLLQGCSGNKTFPNTIRAGETASVAMGWQKRFLRSNTTVTITPSIGEPVVITPDDPAIRAIINFYPDPVSFMVVGTETRQNAMYNFGSTYGDMVNNSFTGKDKDWFQTIAFVDMPQSIPVGETLIELSNPHGDVASSTVEIVEGLGESTAFDAENLGPMTRTQMSSLERSFSYEVLLSGSSVPFAVQLEIAHDAGIVYVVNTRGDLKNITWSDDGAVLKVLMTSTKLVAPSHILDYKFYIAGGYRGFSLQNVLLQDIKAFDVNGFEMTGITASIV